VKDYNGLNYIIPEGQRWHSHYFSFPAGVPGDCWLTVSAEYVRCWSFNMCIPDVCGTPQQVVHGDMRRYKNRGGFTPDTRDACNMFSDVHSLKPLEAEQGSKLAVTLNVPVGLSLIFWRPWPPGRQADALVGPVPIGRRGRLVSSWGKSCLVTRGAGKAIVPWHYLFTAKNGLNIINGWGMFGGYVCIYNIIYYACMMYVHLQVTQTTWLAV